MARFGVGAWVHHKKTNEDGKIKSISEQTGRTIYQVSIPSDASRTSWIMGAEPADWNEDDLESSTNPVLPRD